MAYDEGLAQRVREKMSEQPGYVEKKMFGGIGDGLIVRVGRERYEDALAEPHTGAFDRTGRPMTGWIVVAAAGYEADEDLGSWVQERVALAQSLPAK